MADLEADGWRPIEDAPRDGTPVKIRGATFIAEEPYEAVAVWTARRCPVHLAEGWFPATDLHDGEGDYLNVSHFKPLDAP